MGLFLLVIRFPVYYFPDPPYLLLLLGLLAALAAGQAFAATLKASLMNWSVTRSSRSLAVLRGTTLSLPFFALCAGVCAFLGAGMIIFGFPAWLGFGVAVPLTCGTAALIWFQLSRLIAIVIEKGSQGLDLDNL